MSSSKIFKIHFEKNKKTIFFYFASNLVAILTAGVIFSVTFSKSRLPNEQTACQFKAYRVESYTDIWENHKRKTRERFQSEIHPRYQRGRLQLKCDGARWRTVGEVNGKLANAVGSQYPSHYLRTWCIQHYYRWCAHLGCQQSTEMTSPDDLNGFVCFAERRNLVSARVTSRIKRSLLTTEFQSANCAPNVRPTV